MLSVLRSGQPSLGDSAAMRPSSRQPSGIADLRPPAAGSPRRYKFHATSLPAVRARSSMPPQSSVELSRIECQPKVILGKAFSVAARHDDLPPPESAFYEALRAIPDAAALIDVCSRALAQTHVLRVANHLPAGERSALLATVEEWRPLLGQMPAWPNGAGAQRVARGAACRARRRLDGRRRPRLGTVFVPIFERSAPRTSSRGCLER